MRWTIVAVVFVVIFTVFTAVFAASADKREVRLFPKWVWILLSLLLPFFGGLLYLMVGRPLGGVARPRRSRIIAPDDDPNFLRDLNRRMNKTGKPAKPAAPTDKPAATPTKPEADPKGSPESSSESSPDSKPDDATDGSTDGSTDGDTEDPEPKTGGN